MQHTPSTRGVRANARWHQAVSSAEAPGEGGQGLADGPRKPGPLFVSPSVRTAGEAWR